ncbi:MAG: MauE/DoxX family redox-associated membrane protein [Pseudomonadota bacterium]
MIEFDPIIVLACRYSLALLFAHAAWTKWRAFPYFSATLNEYRLLPPVLVPSAAAGIVASEAAIAVGALASPTATFAMALAAILLIVYISAIGINLTRGRNDIDCGCGGPESKQTLNGWLVVRNLLLVITALVGSASLVLRPLTAIDASLIGLVVLTATVIYLALEQLLSNLPRLDALDEIME